MRFPIKLCEHLLEGIGILAPQAKQVSMSTTKTRLRRCAQIISGID
jgi:hypothetical protein